jgi:integrase
MKDLFDAVLADYRDNIQVKKYTSDRRGTGASNATIHRQLSIVKRAFHLAAKSDPPQVIRVPHIPMLEESNVRKGFLEHDAYLRLRDALPSVSRLLFVAAYHVGCRRGELMRIQWPQAAPIYAVEPEI